ncbi:hypothetical protein BVY03_04690, partial [bacterium K02(2017)]
PGQFPIPQEIFSKTNLKIFLFVSINEEDWQLIVQNEGLEIQEAFTAVNSRMLGGYAAEDFVLKSQTDLLFQELDVEDLPNFKDAQTMVLGNIPFSSQEPDVRYYGFEVFKSFSTTTNPGLYYDRTDNNWKVKKDDGTYAEILTSDTTSLTFSLTTATGTLDASKISGNLTVDTILANVSSSLKETGGGSDTITLQAPANIPASYSLTLPSVAGTNNYVLTTDGNGVLSWTAGGAGGGATLALDNLAAVAINTSLLPAAGDTIDIGSAANQWRDIYFGNNLVYSDTNNTTLSFASPSQNNSIIFPDSSGTVALLSDVQSIIGSNLNSGQIFVGNGSNRVDTVTLSGDATLDSDGVMTIVPNAITGSNIVNQSITASDIAADTLTSGEIATNAIGSLEIATNAVGSAEIDTNAVGPLQIDLSLD